MRRFVKRQKLVVVLGFLDENKILEKRVYSLDSVSLKLTERYQCVNCLPSWP